MKLSSDVFPPTPSEGYAFREAQSGYWAAKDNIRFLQQEIAKFQRYARSLNTIGTCPLAADNLGTSKCSHCHASDLCYSYITGYSDIRESK